MTTDAGGKGPGLIRRWLSGLLARLKRPGGGERKVRWPTKDEIALLPPFEALGLEDIVEVWTTEGAREAHDALKHEKVLGFDTESKPVFRKGEVSTGPHVVQFSTRHKAYVFMLHNREARHTVRALLANNQIRKVGFGLSEDLRRIPIKLGMTPHAVVDIETICAAKGYGRGMGVKVAVAMVLKRKFSKSKKASTSNWMKHRLDDRQLLYAANDAYAALLVYLKLAPRG